MLAGTAGCSGKEMVLLDVEDLVSAEDGGILAEEVSGDFPEGSKCRNRWRNPPCLYIFAGQWKSPGYMSCLREAGFTRP